jgi:superfamily I DNA/RNA helicase
MVLGWPQKADMSFGAWCVTFASTGVIDKPPLHLLAACGVADLTLPEALDAWGMRSDADAFDAAAQRNLIQVATIHASKGREWPGVVVLLSDQVRTRFPRDVATHPEDWRCAFVAFTRAMQRLDVVGTNADLARAWPAATSED